MAEELLFGVVHCESRGRLTERLERGDSLRIKFGIDPSAPDLHLGHLVPLNLLRRWRVAGHQPVLVIGDVTARIGDPSGRSATRPQLTQAEVEANAQTYLDQLSLVVDTSDFEVRRQSEWYSTFDLLQLLRLANTATVAQLLQRSDFEKRIRAEHAIAMQELLYPLLQGYDSVAIAADVELGGTDQLFNLLQARSVQDAYGVPVQDIVTVQLLEGLDGVKKMSKSLGNAVAVSADADEQFGQLMSIPDELIARYFGLLLASGPGEREALEQALASGGVSPRDAKADLAQRLVSWLHAAEQGQRAREEFDRVHRDRQLPTDVPAVAVGTGTAWDIRDLLVAAGLATSRSEARRMVEEGGVELGGTRVRDWRGQVEVEEDSVLRFGKRRVVRLRKVAEDLGPG